jgi:hypothetical protein
MTATDAKQARLGDLFAAIDAKDTERFLGFLTDEASFRFGSAQAVQGREAIHRAVDGLPALYRLCRAETERCLVSQKTEKPLRIFGINRCEQIAQAGLLRISSCHC